MRVVLHVLEALEGGTARHLSDVVRHVEGVDHHVVVPPRRAGGQTDTLAVPEMEASGATVHRVAMRRLPASTRNVTALLALRRLMGRIRPDVVHGHSEVGGALARMAAADRPVLRVYTPNGLHPSPAANAVERTLGPLTHRFIAVSPSEARVAAVRGLVRPDRIVTIPNGIDLSGRNDAIPGRGTSRQIDLADRIDLSDSAAVPAGGRGSAGAGPHPFDISVPVDLRHLLGMADSTPVVGFVGRLVPQKAPEVVVEVAALVRGARPDVRFVMIGSGSRDDAVRSLVHQHRLNGTLHLLPYLPRAARVMDQFDALLLMSRYEGCPYTVLEAMRAGTPVVASDAVGSRDLVVDGVTGRLVRQGHPEDAAAAVIDVLADGDAAARMADAARARLTDHHDVRQMAASLAEIYAGPP